jgi:Ca2+-binding RTX toxin-like protein
VVSLPVSHAVTVAALVALGAVVFGGTQAGAGISCFGKPATVVLTDPNGDEFYGARADDVVVGGPEDDNIVVQGGTNRVCAKGGNDLIRGGRGKDRFKGGPGQDNLDGLQAGDKLLGGRGSESGYADFRGAPDNLQAVIIGGAGDDFIKGGRGIDDCQGGAGHDTKVACK